MILEALSQDLEALVSRVAPAVVAIDHRRGHGSGFVLAPDGYLLTNDHVVRGAREVRVGFADGRELAGEIAGADERTDLAVVRVGASGLASLPLGDRPRVRVGQIVVAVGNPLHFERSVSLGVVSALDRSLAGPRGALFEGLLQTDAAINPGNSGGPLVDVGGTVVGVNTAAVRWAQGIGFAVPAHTASWVAAVLIQKGQVRRPQLGIAARGEDLGEAEARELGQGRAVRVFRVGPTTPAERAGLCEGDLLLAANGEPLSTIDDLQRVMVLAPSPEVRLEVLRAHRRYELTARPAAD
jgi:S1-C subfamily serine protease